MYFRYRETLRQGKYVGLGKINWKGKCRKYIKWNLVIYALLLALLQQFLQRASYSLQDMEI
jgi:hypothetical protein